MMGSGGFNSQPARPTAPVSSQQQRMQQTSSLRPEQQQQQQITSPQKMQAPQQMSRVPSTGSLGSMGVQVQSQPSMNMSMFQQQAHQPWLGQPRPTQPSSAAYQTQQQQQVQQKQQQQQQVQQPQQQWQLSQPQQSKQQQQQLSMQQLSQMQQRVQLVGNQRPSTPTGSQLSSSTGPSNSVPSGASANQTSSFDNRILGKRNIQEFMAQMDPQQRLDAEGEDVSVEKSDDFSETKQAHLQPIGPSGNSMQGLQSMGLMGSGGLGSQLVRPLAPISSQQQRMQQTTLRPPQQQQPITSPQKMQTPQQMLRGPAAGSLGSQFQSMSPSSQPFTNMNTHQQWLSNQAKQVQPTSAAYQSQYQQQAQQRQQQQQTQQPQQQRQQPQQQQQLKPQQQQSTQLPQMQHRVQLIGNQRPPTPMGAQQSVVTGPLSSLPSGEPTNQASSSNKSILGKRSIQELVAQVDPHQRLDPEVEDILVEIADDFIETVTASACALAKHRKSSTLEVKDVLLHLERNWHIVIPGFGNDEYRCYKKPAISEAHKQRIQLVKKSLSTTPHSGNEAGATKNVAAPTTNGSKSLQHPSTSASLLASSLSSPGPSHASR